MKLNHAIAIGLLVVGLSAAFLLYEQGHMLKTVSIFAALTLVVSAVVATGGRCPLTAKRSL